MDLYGSLDDYWYIETYLYIQIYTHMDRLSYWYSLNLIKISSDLRIRHHPNTRFIQSVGRQLGLPNVAALGRSVVAALGQEHQHKVHVTCTIVRWTYGKWLEKTWNFPLNMVIYFPSLCYSHCQRVQQPKPGFSLGWNHRLGPSSLARFGQWGHYSWTAWCFQMYSKRSGSDGLPWGNPCWFND